MCPLPPPPTSRLLVTAEEGSHGCSGFRRGVTRQRSYGGGRGEGSGVGFTASEGKAGGGWGVEGAAFMTDAASPPALELMVWAEFFKPRLAAGAEGADT